MGLQSPPKVPGAKRGEVLLPALRCGQEIAATLPVEVPAPPIAAQSPRMVSANGHRDGRERHAPTRERDSAQRLLSFGPDDDEVRPAAIREPPLDDVAHALASWVRLKAPDAKELLLQRRRPPSAPGDLREPTIGEPKFRSTIVPADVDEGARIVPPQRATSAKLEA